MTKSFAPGQTSAIVVRRCDGYIPAKRVPRIRDSACESCFRWRSATGTIACMQSWASHWALQRGVNRSGMRWQMQLIGWSPQHGPPPRFARSSYGLAPVLRISGRFRSDESAGIQRDTRSGFTARMKPIQSCKSPFLLARRFGRHHGLRAKKRALLRIAFSSFATLS